MMPSHFVIFQVSIIVLLMTAFTYSTQSAAMVPEISQSYDDEVIIFFHKLILSLHF
jgi:hypothetical protein